MVQPPQSTQRRDVKVLSPLEAYTKDLLVFRLCTKDISIGQVSKQLLRYPWSDVDIDCGSLITKYLLKACRKGRYKSISAVALLISNMRKTKPEILTRIIDAVLEELQFSLEYPTFRDQQRSLIYAKLLGELHCQSLVSGSIIVDHLYNFLNFGHEIPATLLDKCNEDEEKQPEIIGGPRAITGVINEDEEMNQEDLDADEAVTTQPVNVSKYSKFDPRIPSQLDVESSVFRIKLVCTLLDSSASCLLYTGTISKLEKFMAAFQRYLFIKSNLPADIEFCILDTFDIIDSKLKRNKNQHMSSLRYKSWLEAHNSVVKAEELDAIAEIRSKKRVYAQAGVRVEGSEDGLVCEDLNDLGDDDISLNSHNNDSIEDSSLRSSGDESDESDDEAISIDDISNANEINDDDLYNHHDEDDDSYENGIHDEDVMHDEYMRKLEDEAFEKELRKLTMDALERGKNTARTAVSSKVSDNMPSASQFAGKKGLLQYADTSSNDAFALGGEAGMAFKLIKRGHKGRVESKNIIVPSDTNLAKVATKQDNEAARERDILKARVLHYEAESAVQAFSGDVYTDQPRLPENRNRQGLTMEDIDRNFGSSNPFQRRDRGGGGRGSSRTLWRS
jgi:regulator of nonsense transcripts 2